MPPGLDHGSRLIRAAPKGNPSSRFGDDPAISSACLSGRPHIRRVETSPEDVDGGTQRQRGCRRICKEAPISYYFLRTIETTFDDAVRRTRDAPKQEGFGVITGIDVQKTLRTKIGVDFRPYLILGACNPAMAHEALMVEDKVGAMLPCNVVLQERSAGTVEIAAIDLVASMQAIENDALKEEAAAVAAKLRNAVGRI